MNSRFFNLLRRQPAFPIFLVSRSIKKLTFGHEADALSMGRKSRFPAPRSRVVIRFAQITKAKPNANTRTLRPDKCLVVSSLFPGLRPSCPRNTGTNAATTRTNGLQFRRFRASLIPNEIRNVQILQPN
jgi:hypothetical protein